MSAIAAITPLAYLDVPDEIWQGGIYDGGDEDAALFNIYTNLNALESAALDVAASPSPWVDLVLPQYETFTPRHIFSLDPSRGPPAS